MKRLVGTLAILTLCAGTAWADGPQRTPAVSPYDDGRVLSDYSVGVGEMPGGGPSRGITIGVYASSAPNGYGAPSWSGYAANALYALENGLSVNGDRSTDPTGYEWAPAQVPGGEIAVTSFNSWRGVVDPAAPFANELGNRMHFGLHASGDGTTQFRLADLTFALHSDDPWDSLVFVGDFVGFDYNGTTRYGIDWGTDRVKGGGDDIVYTSGNGTTPVDEIVYVGVGNAWWPGGGDPDPSNPLAGKQGAMDEYFAWLASVGPINATCTYGFTGSGDTGSDTVTIVPPEELSIYPSLVPDEQEPRVNLGDAPATFEPDSWQNSATGKVNWHARYLADGDFLTALFPDQAAILTINDLESIRYSTKRPTGTTAGQDWAVFLYTRPPGDASWYGKRFVNNFDAHTETDAWTQYSTATGMTFRKNSGTPTGHMSLDDLKTAYGTELVEMISVMTMSNWSEVFDGYMDGLIVTLTDGTVGRVNFVGGALTLEPDADCYMQDDYVTVELWMHDITENISGGQFFLEYDDDVLSFGDAVAGPSFTELYEVTPSAGLIDYAVFIMYPGSVTGDQHMATITFIAQEQICTEPDLVAFRPHDPPTRLSDDQLPSNPVYPALVDMDVIDNVAPDITCPADATVECSDTAGITIDGVIGAGEWDGAHEIEVVSGMGTVSLKTDADYLYVLLDVVDTTDARLGQNPVGNDQVGLNINPTDGGSWGFPYDLIFQTGADPAAWGGNSSGMSDGWYTQLKIFDVEQTSLPCGLATMTLFNPTRVSEWRIPLDIFSASIGDNQEIGGAIDVGDGSSYVFPIGLVWSDASTFFDRTVTWDFPTTGAATATDNCDPDPVISFTDDTSGLTGCNGTGTITRTWQAEDYCANISTCDQIITVEDTTDPIIQNPDNVTIECDDPRLLTGLEPEPWNHKMHYPQLPDPFGWDVNATFPQVVADDWTCSETGEVLDIHFWGSWKDLDGNQHTDPHEVGQILGFWVSIHLNEFGAPSMPAERVWFEFVPHEYVTVVPIDPFDPPVLEGWYNPDPYSAECIPDDHDAYFRYDIDIVAAGLVPFPQEAGTTYWLDISAVVAPVAPPQPVWGWKTTQSHYLDDAVWSIYDGDPPVDPPTWWEELHNCMEPFESLDMAFVITAGGLAPDVGIAYAEDNCYDGVLPYLGPGVPGVLGVTYTDVVNLGDCNGTGTITRTWTATDDCGNVSTCTPQIITVVDTTPPVITCQTDIGPVNNDPDVCEASVLFTSTATDNCCTPTIVHRIETTPGSGVFDIIITSPHVFPVGTTTVQATATDGCGLTDVCTFTVQVVDTENPTITCPPDDSVNADAGVCTAYVTVPAPTGVTDNCGVLSTLNDFNGTSDASDTYPQGPTIVTWTVTDIYGNTAQCTHTITVNAFNDLVVNVELSPTMYDPTPGTPGNTVTRCITFELWECTTPSSQIVTQDITFCVDVGLPHVGSATFDVPCDLYTCITARDTLHTLRRTLVAPDFDIVGTQYVADFVTPGKDLIGGNLNDDFWIDILDFGTFSAQWGIALPADTPCSYTPPSGVHADINGSGIVDTADFTFIFGNFLEGHESNCCGAPDGSGAGPITEISVKELYELGLGHLAVADLNADGWLDEADIAAFMQGARPNLPNELEPTQEPSGIPSLRKGP